MFWGNSSLDHFST